MTNKIQPSAETRDDGTTTTMNDGPSPREQPFIPKFKQNFMQENGGNVSGRHSPPTLQDHITPRETPREPDDTHFSARTSSARLSAREPFAAGSARIATSSNGDQSPSSANLSSPSMGKGVSDAGGSARSLPPDQSMPSSNTLGVGLGDNRRSSIASNHTDNERAFDDFHNAFNHIKQSTTLGFQAAPRSARLDEKAIEIHAEKYVPLKFAQEKVKRILGDWTQMKMEYMKNLDRIEKQYKQAEKEDQEYMRTFVKTYAKRYKALKTQLRTQIRSKDLDVKKLERQIKILQGADVTQLDQEIEQQQQDNLSEISSEAHQDDMVFLKTLDRRTFATAEIQTNPVSFKDPNAPGGEDDIEKHKQIRQANEMLNDEVGRLQSSLQAMTEYYDAKLKEKDIEMEELSGQIQDLESFKQKIIELEEGSDNEEELDALITERSSRQKTASRETSSAVSHLQRTLTQTTLNIEEMRASATKKEGEMRKEIDDLNQTIKSLRAQIVRLTEEKDKEDDEPKEKSEETSEAAESTPEDGDKSKLVEALKARVEESKKKLARITNQKSVLLESLSNLKDDLSKKQQALESQKDELEKNQQLVANLRLEINKAHDSVAEKDELIEQLEKKVQRLASQGSARPQTTTGQDAKRELKNLKILQLAKEQELATSEKRNQTLQQKLEESQKNAQKVESKYQAQLQEAEQQLEAIKEQQAKLVEKMKAAVEKKIERALAKKTKELDTFKEHHEIFKSKVTKLAKELEKTRKDKASLEQQVDELQKSSSENEQIVTQLQQQIEEDAHFKEDYEKASKDLSQFKKEYDVMQENLMKAEDNVRKYYNMVEDMKGKIRVYARLRPFNDKEKDRSVHQPIVDVLDKMALKVTPKDRTFRFNRVFDMDTEQDAVFKDTKDLIPSAIDGYNVCIFAYGQTGTGKTYTMSYLTRETVRGAFLVAEKRKKHHDIKFEVQMVELYLDELEDLLAAEQNKFRSRLTGESKTGKMDIKKDGNGNVVILNSVLIECDSAEEMLEVFRAGEKNRHQRSTGMNADSSRSHLVFTVHISSVNKNTGDASIGKLTLVDLAGSENRKKTGLTDKVALDEAKSINMSLLHLGEVINSLSSGKRPNYRNNKLTMLLADSLGGSAKTLMFVCIGPSSYNLEETINSLNYAERVKKIKNEVSKKVESKMMRIYRSKMERLQELLFFALDNAGRLPEGVRRDALFSADEQEDMQQIK